jgi:peptidoglycan L-alanyl-D-glutamate endopeptidase CwlK
MPFFGERSNKRLSTCHVDLQKICKEAIKHFDFYVDIGHRSIEDQYLYFTKGREFIDGKWEIVNESLVITYLDGRENKSKHNEYPSMAVDIYPFPYPEKRPIQQEREMYRFYYLAGIMTCISNQLYNNKEISHKLRWGGDFDGDQKFYNNKFLDCPHFELVT